MNNPDRQIPREGPAPARRVASGVIRTAEIAAVAALVWGYFALDEHNRAMSARQREIAAEAQAVHARIDTIRTAANEEIESLKTSLAVVGDSARSREERLRADLDRATDALGAQARKIVELSDLQGERLARSESVIGSRIEQLAAQLATDRTAQASAAHRFRDIQEAADQSVFLLHCVFTYETKEFDEGWKEHQATTWGTAFAVSDNGHLITNKHLVMPWKFDSELAALAAMGEVRIREDSVRLAVWPVGTTCLDDARKANFAGGYDNGRGSLAIIATAPDHLNEKSIDMAGRTIKYKMHALDNNDLALLKVERPTRALHFAPAPTDASLKKLDAVMAIGFPRGVGGLESTVAVPSATVGAVRKVEDTIHISAPIVAGNSGGPVFDDQGRVIGIATRIYCETLGICIKADHARKLMDGARGAPSVVLASTPAAK